MLHLLFPLQSPTPLLQSLLGSIVSPFMVTLVMSSISIFLPKIELIQECLAFAGCSLNTVAGKSKCEVIAVTRHGGTGRTAEGKSTLEGQLVHGELIGMDQPPVPGESRDGEGSAPPALGLLLHSRHLLRQDSTSF